MRNLLLALISITTLTISSCKKDKLNPNKDNTTAWVGTYTGNAGSTVNRIIISRVDNVTLRMELQTTSFVGFITYATIQNAKLQTPTTCKIDEEGVIAGFSGVYKFTGSAALNGNNLTLSGNATNKTDPGDVKLYYFTGSK